MARSRFDEPPDQEAIHQTTLARANQPHELLGIRVAPVPAQLEPALAQPLVDCAEVAELFDGERTELPDQTFVIGVGDDERHGGSGRLFFAVGVVYEDPIEVGERHFEPFSAGVTVRSANHRRCSRVGRLHLFTNWFEVRAAFR